MESINIAVWLAIGAAVGWLATLLKPSADRIVFLETMAVAIFGAFIGGEFVAALLRSSPKDSTLSLGGVVLAIVSSAVALVLL